MKLYYSKGACSLVIRIIINEIGLKAAYEAVNLQTKKTANDTDFLTINPKGAVPVLQISNQEILTENAVILQYLADTTQSFQLLPEPGTLQRYRVLEWLNYITTELHKSFAPLFNPDISQPIKETMFIPLIEKKFKYIDKHLASHDYLMAGHFTLPDAYLFVMVLWGHSMKINMNQFPHLLQYFERLKGRDSIQRSLQEEGISI